MSFSIEQALSNGHQVLQDMFDTLARLDLCIEYPTQCPVCMRLRDFKR